MSDETTPQDGKAMSPASAGSVENVYFSYRDMNDEIQHCKIPAEEAGRLLGDAMTMIYRLRNAATQLAEIADSESDLFSRRGMLAEMATSMSGK